MFDAVEQRGTNRGIDEVTLEFVRHRSLSENARVQPFNNCLCAADPVFNRTDCVAILRNTTAKKFDRLFPLQYTGFSTGFFGWGGYFGDFRPFFGSNYLKREFYTFNLVHGG